MTTLRRVIVESPFAGDVEMNQAQLNIQEARRQGYRDPQAAVKAALRGLRYVRKMARDKVGGTPPAHLMEKLKLARSAK